MGISNKRGVVLMAGAIVVLLSAIVCAQSAPNEHSYAATDLPNVFTAVNQFSVGEFTGPMTYAQITALTFVNPGTMITCTNCTLPSNPCTVGSSQVVAIYLNGGWNCNAGGIGGGTISGLTLNAIPMATSSTTIGNSSPLLDDGATKANWLTYAGSGFQLPSDGVHAGGFGMIGNTTLPLGLPASNYFGFLGPASASFTSYFLQPPSTAPSGTQYLGCGTPSSNVSTCGWNTLITGATTSGGILQTGTTLGLLTSCSSTQVLAWNGSAWACAANGGTTLPNGQNGDSLRWNVYGDNKWDATQGAERRFVTTYVDGTNGAQGIYGAAQGTGLSHTLSNSTASVLASANDSAGVTFSSSSSASSNVVIGQDFSSGANFGAYSFGGIYRWAHRFTPGQITNARYWMGETVFNTGGSGTETTAPATANVSFANDTPNRTTLGFRFSSGTDTNWMCTSQTTGGSQTATSTGVAPDTSNPHTFEITYDGTTERCFIDGTLTASVTTNLPATSVFRVVSFWVGDNKNTANVVSATTYWMTVELR